MDMLYSRPMPVADHFMASWDSANDQTAAAFSGDVCETCYAHCAAGKTELWRHARDEHGADPALSCHAPGCGRRFFAAAMCADHREHHRRDDAAAGPGGRPPLTCELCGRLSADRSKHDRHVSAAHPEAVAATCGVCQSYEGDVQSLIRHVRRRHAHEVWPETAATSEPYPERPCIGRKSIRCDVCGKRYGNHRNMLVHRRVHGIVDLVFPASPRPQSSGARTAAVPAAMQRSRSIPVMRPQRCIIPVHPSQVQQYSRAHPYRRPPLYTVSAHRSS